MRKLYACGLQITTVGPNDGNNVFTHFLIANGGEGIITPDGKLHTDDPKVREAAIKSVEFMTNLYKEGVVPPEALSWNDADDNNGYPREAVHDGLRRHAVDRAGDDQGQAGVLPRHADDGADQRRTMARR